MSNFENLTKEKVRSIFKEWARLTLEGETISMSERTELMKVCSKLNLLQDYREGNKLLSDASTEKINTVLENLKKDRENRQKRGGAL